MRIGRLELKMNVNLIQPSTVLVLSTEEICSKCARIVGRHGRAAPQLTLNTRLAVS